jgi:hypothetical protein
VCLPGIGSFVNVYQSAFNDFEKYSFVPPSKKIAFNPQLTEDENLISNYIAEKEHLTKIEAKTFLETIITKMQTDLDSGKQVVLLGFGVIQKGLDGNNFFVDNSQDNFLEEAYGLQPFSLKKEEELESSQTVEPEEISDAEEEDVIQMQARSQAQAQESNEEVPQANEVIAQKIDEEVYVATAPEIVATRGFRVPNVVVLFLTILLLMLIFTYAYLAF